MKKVLPLLMGACLMVFVTGLFFAERPSRHTMPRATVAQQPPVLIFASPDGRALLEVDPSSLPAGTDPSAISIMPYDGDDAAGNPGFVTYVLEPDGLEFSSPAKVTLILDTDDGAEGVGIPFLALVNQENEKVLIDPVNNTEVVIGANGGQLAVSGEISHFSFLRASVSGLFRMYRTSPDSDQFVSGPVSFGGYVEATGGSDWTSHYVGIESYTVTPGTTWTAGGWLRSTHPSYLEPEKIELDDETLDQDGKYEIFETFTCAKEGEGYIMPYVTIRYSLHSRFRGKRDGNGEHTIIEGDERVSTGIAYQPQYTTQNKLRQKYACRKNEGGGGWVRVCPMYTIICDPDGGSKHGFVSGSYRCDPQTGEIIPDALGNPVDSKTGRPPGEQCPNQ